MSVFVLVLLSVERFSVSCLLEFFFTVTYSTLVNLVSFRFGIGATIRTRQELQCLPYADVFFCTGTYSTLVNLVSVRFGIGVSIRTHREIQCLLHAGFLFYSDILYAG